MDEDELANLYRAEATQSLEEEAAKRIAESADSELDERLHPSLKELMDSDELVAAIIARLGMVRAAFIGGGIKVEHISEEERTGPDPNRMVLALLVGPHPDIARHSRFTGDGRSRTA